MIDVAQLTEYVKVGGIVGSVVGAFVWAAFGGRSWVKRRSSGDDVAIAAGAAEVGMLQRAMEEADRQRQRADLAYSERNQAVQELGGLRAKVEGLELHRIDCERRVGNLEMQIEAMRKLIDELVRGKQ